MIVTIFKNITSTGTPYYVPLAKVIERIKTGKSKDLIQSIRKEKDSSTRNGFKRDLPSLCLSGKFTSRADSALEQHSGLICLDFDKFETKKELAEYRATLAEDEYTHCLFTSPSGDGLKLIVKIPADPENHKSYFDALGEYYDSPNFDVKCSNLSRVCYESYDPQILFNEGSDTWTELAIDSGTKFTDTEVRPVMPLYDPNKIIEKLEIWFNKNYNMAEGSRNNNLFSLAAAFNNYGLDKVVAQSYLHQYQDKGFPMAEIDQLVESAYRKTAEHGIKYFEDKDTVSKIGDMIVSGASSKELGAVMKAKGVSEEHHPSVIEKALEGISGEQFWEDERGVRLVPSKFKNFLQNNNFYKYYNYNADIPSFIKIDHGQVEEINVIKIKDFTLDYLKKDGSKHVRVWDHCANKTSYFSENYLNMIDAEELKLLEDTDEESFICYSNGVLKITEDSTELIEYADIGKHVWKNQVLDREYHKKKEKPNDFKTFIHNICANEPTRIKTMESTIGYCMHSYKKRHESFAVIFNDEDLSDNPNGGSGKSLIMNALKKFRRTEEINGKSFEPNKAFLFQRVSMDTQILAFDDVKPKFDFESLFSLITEGIEIERKGKDAYYIPFEKSPKIIISTNYVIKGSGHSHSRRRWEVELHQHYNDKITPISEFGRKFWEDWDKADWDDFDNYMIGCLQLYLTDGLIKSESINIDKKQIIQDTSMEFFEWCEDEDGMVNNNCKMNKQELFDRFVKENRDYEKWFRRNKCTRWLKKYAAFKGLETEEGQDTTGKWICIKGKNFKGHNEPEADEMPF